jgi:hypothetical protein
MKCVPTRGTNNTIITGTEVLVNGLVAAIIRKENLARSFMWGL